MFRFTSALLRQQQQQRSFVTSSITRFSKSSSIANAATATPVATAAPVVAPRKRKIGAFRGG